MSANTIALTDFCRLLEQGKPLTVLDVRTPAEYKKVHLAGARSLPLDDLDPAAVARDNPGADPIYVICQSGGRAAKACERLQQAGVARVLSIEGGTAACEKAGLSLERGSCKVISLERQVRIGAGSLVLLGVLLAWLVHPALIGISAFVGAGLIFAGISDYCGMGMLLGKMPWNR